MTDTRTLLKTCKNGHDLTDPANVYVRPNGSIRCCRVCKLSYQKQWRSENVDYIHNYNAKYNDENRGRHGN